MTRIAQMRMYVEHIVHMHDMLHRSTFSVPSFRTAAAARPRCMSDSSSDVEVLSVKQARAQKRVRGSVMASVLPTLKQEPKEEPLEDEEEPAQQDEAYFEEEALQQEDGDEEAPLDDDEFVAQPVEGGAYENGYDEEQAEEPFVTDVVGDTVDEVPCSSADGDVQGTRAPRTPVKKARPSKPPRKAGAMPPRKAPKPSSRRAHMTAVKAAQSAYGGGGGGGGSSSSNPRVVPPRVVPPLLPIPGPPAGPPRGWPVGAPPPPPPPVPVHEPRPPQGKPPEHLLHKGVEAKLPAGVLKAGPVTKEEVAAAKAAAVATCSAGGDGTEPPKKKTKRGGWHNRCQKLCDRVLFSDNLEETKRLAWQYYSKKKTKKGHSAESSDTSSTS